MIAKTFLDFFQRDLEKLKEEITLFPEDRLWLVNGEIKNSAGNLALHITGNLKHFIGAVMGDTGYIRQRDKEFSDKNVTKEKLLQGLTESETIVTTVLSALTDEKLMQPYPVETFGKNSTTLRALIQLIAHLDYHLGQVNYLRRLG
jgi:uncharacterized damage-inducible protein DinB